MVIPVHDANPTRRPAYVTRTLIVANLAIFVVSPLVLGQQPGETTAQSLCGVQAFFERWGAIPQELLTNEQLDVVTGDPVVDPSGAVACRLVPPDYEKVPALSVLTAMFLHGGWAHVLGNMLYLAIFGNNIEERLGRIRFLLFYLVAGYAATYAFALSDPDSRATLVGASGAIAGVLGAYLVWFPRVTVTSLVPFLFFIPVRLPAWFVLGTWFAVQWIYSAGLGVSAQAEVAYLAHVAGFVVGALIAAMLGRPQPPTRYRSGYPRGSGDPYGRR